MADPLHEDAPAKAHWTTANIGEAVPGVPTPLSWTLFGPAIEAAMKGAFISTGAFSPAEWPDPPIAEDRIVGIFYGRPVLRLDTMAVLGDRMPGTSGYQVVESFYGAVPDDMEFAPTRRRVPAIALRLTRSHLRIASRLEEAARGTPAWRFEQLSRVEAASSAAECAAIFGGAQARFGHIVLLQAIAAMCAVQATFDAISQLAAAAGVEDVVSLTSGYGNTPEAAPIRDVWRVSRGELPFDQLVRLHGQHGPFEGELSARVWREDPTPLRRLVAEYAKKDTSENPMALEAARARQRERLEAELLAGLPALARPVGRRLLAHGRRMIPLRGVAKAQFLRAFDVARAAARRAGAFHSAAGVLDDPDDVFYLTVDELLAGSVARDAVAFRREKRAEYERMILPTFWTGLPEPLEASAPSGRTVIDGIGVSTGVVEGIARVVTDPTFADVEPGEVLVSSTTDPGWASIMFIASALVVDIGGLMSHAAVVARELGIPCVVDTRDGSRAIRSGDRLRVDGDTGTVTVLARA